MIETDEPVAIAPPDLAGYRNGPLGVDFVQHIDSGFPGPHVLVCALVHGNEYCGAVALDHWLRAPPKLRTGRVTAAFVNMAAFRQFTSGDPQASRFLDEDFNRLWTPEVLDGPLSSRELTRARELRPLVDEADFLLDLHSMQYPSPPLLMCGPLEKGRRLAFALGLSYDVIGDAGHRAGRRLRDYGGFGDPASPKNALLVECGQHWAEDSVTVAATVLRRFLAHLGLTDAGPRPAGARPRLIEVTEVVTAATDDFQFVLPCRGMEVIARAGTAIARDGGRAIATPHDDCVLVMPSRRPRKGQTALRFGRISP